MPAFRPAPHGSGALSALQQPLLLDEPLPPLPAVGSPPREEGGDDDDDERRNPAGSTGTSTPNTARRSISTSTGTHRSADGAAGGGPVEHRVDAEEEDGMGGERSLRSIGDLSAPRGGVFWWSRLTGGEPDTARVGDEVRVLSHPAWAPLGVRRCGMLSVVALVLLMSAALGFDLWMERHRGALQASVVFDAIVAEELLSQMAEPAHRRAFERSYAKDLLRAVSPAARSGATVRIAGITRVEPEPGTSFVGTGNAADEEPVGVVVETEVIFTCNMEDRRGEWTQREPPLYISPKTTAFCLFVSLSLPPSTSHFSPTAFSTLHLLILKTYNM